MNRFTYILPIIGFGILGFFGSAIATLPTVWFNIVTLTVVMLVVSQMLLKWNDPNIDWINFFISVSQASLEFAVNFLLLSYHIGTSDPMVSATFGVAGGLSLFAFLGITLLVSIYDSKN